MTLDSHLHLLGGLVIKKSNQQTLAHSISSIISIIVGIIMCLTRTCQTRFRMIGLYLNSCMCDFEWFFKYGIYILKNHLRFLRIHYDYARQNRIIPNVIADHHGV